VTFVNHGVNRERTDQIALRLDAALSGADAIVLQGGINDVVQGRPLDLVVADVDVMIERALRRVGTVVVVDVLPGTTATTSRRRRSCG
jgi:lysophospholipase L1-like esterase